MTGTAFAGLTGALSPLGGRDFPLDKRGGFYYTETNEKKQAGKKRSTFPNAVRESCPPAERQLRNAGMEGSFGAGAVKEE